MPLHQDNIGTVIAKLSVIDKLYNEKRLAFDKNRHFGGWRASTANPQRKQDCVFIQTIADWIQKNKFGFGETYGSYDEIFKGMKAGANYSNDIAPFLKQAMLGACLLTALKINRSYMLAWVGRCQEVSVKQYSALASILLDGFGVEKLSDVSLIASRDYLAAFVRFIEMIDKQQKEIASTSPQQWHPEYTNDVLLQQVKTELGQVETAISAMSEEQRTALRA